MGQRRKYFFFDYDGTLAIPLTRTIPESTLATLEALRAQGHFISLATGRLQVNALDFISETGIDNLVADGGNSVTIGGKLLWMEPLDPAPVRACLHRLDGLGIPWAVTTANELVRYSPCKEFAEVSADYYVPTAYDPDLVIDELETIYKAYIPCKPDEEEPLLATGALDGVPHVRYNSDNLFIEPMDKHRGIVRMMEELDAPLADVVVFGDGFNDVTMFSPEWTSIAMGNAREVLKQRADFVTAACDDDGIMKACEHYGWI